MPPYPPRTTFEAKKLFDGDIVEIDGVFCASEWDEATQVRRLHRIIMIHDKSPF